MNARFSIGANAATCVIALTAVMFGLAPLFARILQDQGLGDPAIAFYRYFLSAVALAVFLPRTRALRMQAAMMFGAGLLMSVAWLSYLEALKTQPVAALGVVYMSYPLFASLLAWALARLRPTPRALCAGMLILAGAATVMLVAPGPVAVDPLRLAFALPAPAGFGLVIVVLTLLTPDLSALQKMACGMAGATLGLVPPVLAAPAGALWPASVEAVALVLGFALATALAPQVLYTLSAPQVGPARAAAAGAFELPTMMAVGWLAFGEPLTGAGLIAAMLVVAAMVLAPAVPPTPDASALRSGHVARTAP